MNTYPASDALTIEKHGEVTVVVASPVIEYMESSMIEGASSLLLEALRDQACPNVIVDLTGLGHFGSPFLSLLIRCWKLTTFAGGTFALAGVSRQSKDLLHMTSLDQVWPMYADRREAIETLDGE